MKRRITDTGGSYGVGLPTGRKLMAVASGPYRGRRVAVLQTDTHELALSWSDKPYTSWSSPSAFASDAADEAFDCVMDGSGNIHVVYSENSTNYLVTRKLSFGGGDWSAGLKVTVYNANESYYPSLEIDRDGGLWVAWSRLTGAFYSLHAKNSSNGGASWGTGPSDGGDQLTGGSSQLHAKLVMTPSEVFAVYTHASDTLSVRRRPVSGGSWDDALDLASGGTDFDEHFDAAVSANGLVGVVFDQASLKYREFSGANWGPVVTLDADEGFFPQLTFNTDVPVVVYLSATASDQRQLMFTSRRTGSFSTPEPLERSARQFDAVLLYAASAASYADLTSEAAGAASADVYHPATNCLVQAQGDVVYLGLEQRFRYVKLLLSTAGAGGTVAYSYWDGANWKAFTPAGGAFHLDATDHDLLLWTDQDSIPGDWQRTPVNGTSRFWIRLDVSAAFSSGPVGSQLTAISDIDGLILRK